MRVQEVYCEHSQYIYTASTLKCSCFALQPVVKFASYSEYTGHIESILLLRVLAVGAVPTDEILPVPAVQNPKELKYMEYPQLQRRTPKYCEPTSIRSAEPRNTASTRSVRSTCCECTKYLQHFSRKLFTLLPDNGSICCGTMHQTHDTSSITFRGIDSFKYRVLQRTAMRVLRASCRQSRTVQQSFAGLAFAVSSTSRMVQTGKYD